MRQIPILVIMAWVALAIILIHEEESHKLPSDQVHQREFYRQQVKEIQHHVEDQVATYSRSAAKAANKAAMEKQLGRLGQSLFIAAENVLSIKVPKGYEGYTLHYSSEIFRASRLAEQASEGKLSYFGVKLDKLQESMNHTLRAIYKTIQVEIGH